MLACLVLVRRRSARASGRTRRDLLPEQRARARVELRVRAADEHDEAAEPRRVLEQRVAVLARGLGAAGAEREAVGGERVARAPLALGVAARGERGGEDLGAVVRLRGHAAASAACSARTAARRAAVAP